MTESKPPSHSCLTELLLILVSLALPWEISLTTSPIVCHFQHQVLSCRSNTCIHILAHIGQWPKDQAIRRIARITVYSWTVIDSIRITYEMKGDGPIRAITAQHGGSGGRESLNIELAGKFRVNYILFLDVRSCSPPRDFRMPKTHRRLWSPAQ